MGYLVFSDVFENKIYKYTPGMGEPEVLLDPAGCLKPEEDYCTQRLEPGSNGLAWDPVTNELVICEHGERRLTRVSHKDGYRVPLVTGYEGKRLNSPNDLIFSRNGDMLFTDPIFGLKYVEHERELDIMGVYMVKRDQLD